MANSVQEKDLRSEWIASAAQYSGQGRKGLLNILDEPGAFIRSLRFD